MRKGTHFFAYNPLSIARGDDAVPFISVQEVLSVKRHVREISGGQALFVAIDRCCYIRGMVVENGRNDVPTLRKVLIARFVDMQI